MRFYAFGNYYLSSLQQALQAHHACQEIYNIYQTPAKRDIYSDWSKNHKTIVLLNGGNSADLQDLYNFFNLADNPYLFAKFHEDEQSLNNALTSVGIILPSMIYETAANDRKYRGESYDRPILSAFQEQLVERLNQYGLAK
jgi:hypothetical protein